MAELFGVSNDVVKWALTGGFKVKDKNTGEWRDAHGVRSLTFLEPFKKFILTYGTSMTDAGFVFVDRYKDDWDLK
jgi:hypothetical protein